MAIGPVRPETHKNGDDLIFRFLAVGKLAANQCYLLHVEMVNPNIHPGGNFGDEWLDTAHCGDTSSGDKQLTFTLYRATFHNLPNYGTIESQATQGNQPTEMLKVTWNVRVVQNNGLSSDGVHYKVVPLSQPSSTLDFDFRP